MSDTNIAIIQGRLTRSPEQRQTPSGTPVMDLSLASNRHVRKADGSGYEQFTTFVKVTLWNERATRWAKKLDIGDEVMVQGQLVDDNFTRSDDQKTSGRLKIDNVMDLKLLRKASGKTTEDASV